MNSQLVLELIGYGASLMIAISLMMKSLIRLRVINGLGALVFVVYGLLIRAYPVAILNGLIVIIDAYYLIQMNQRKDYFTLMQITPESTYLKVFLRLQMSDIQKYFPGFAYQPKAEDLLYFILRDTIPAGLVIIRQQDDLGQVLLDYALPNYRDLKIGAFVFKDHADTLLRENLECLQADGVVPSHANYLRQMGFEEIGGNQYALKLEPHVIRDRKL